MKFRLPARLRRHMRAHREVPGEYGCLLVPGTETGYITFPGGWILSQSAETVHARVRIHHFFMERTLTVMPVTEGTATVTLAFILEREADCLLEACEPVTLRPGVFYLFYLAARTVHSATLPAGMTTIVHIDYDAGWIAGMVRPNGVLGGIVQRAMADGPSAYHHYPVPMDTASRLMLDELCRCREEDPVQRTLFLGGKALGLIAAYRAALLRELQEPPAQTAAAIKVRSVRDRILENPGDLPSVAQLAADAGMQTAVLQVLFRERYGYTPGDFIRRQRMEQAAKLLRTTTLPVGRIADMTGYGDFSAFSRAFRQHFQRTPSAYRAGKDEG